MSLSIPLLVPITRVQSSPIWSEVSKQSLEKPAKIDLKEIEDLFCAAQPKAIEGTIFLFSPLFLI
jgi:hypothetical protein